LRDDWRRQFGKDLGFLVVQLANYGPAPTRPTESGWAGVREAQRLVAAEDARSGLAVAIDIGDRYDIHPANKQQVGKRLARAARKAVYGERIAASGPVPRSAKREGEAVVVEFGDATGGLVAYSAEFPIGFELCGADAGSCQYARAEIRGDRVALQASNAAQATRVRYCWADSPVCTPLRADGLPAGPFEVPVAPQAKGRAPMNSQIHTEPNTRGSKNDREIVDAKVIVTCPGRNFVTLKITTRSGVYGLGDA